MKSRKKLLALCLALMLSLAMLAGCGGGAAPDADGGASAPAADDGSAPADEPAAGGETTIEFWMLPLIEDDATQALVDNFTAENPDVKVNMTMLDWASGREQIKQAVAAGSGPDVFYLSAGLDIAYVEAGLLLPLEEAGFTAEDLGRYGKLIDASAVDGKVMAAPISYEEYLLYYRSDILADYGFDAPPTTWEEMKTMAKAITDGSGGEIMGYQHKGADDHLNAINMTWQTFLWQAGGSLMDLDAMKSTENSPEAVAALEYMKSFYDEGISQLGTSAANGFREGKVAMYSFTNGPLTSEGYVGDAELEGKWGIATLPAGANGAGGYLGGHALCINAATANAEAAGRFVKHFTSPANAPVWMESFYAVQPYDMDKLEAEEKAAIEAVIAGQPEIWEPVIASAEASSPDFMVQSRHGYTARWDGQKRLIVAALNGEMSIEDALTQLDVEIDQSL